MSKKPTIPTSEELKQMIEVGTASRAAEVAEAVFKKGFEDGKKEIEGKITNLIYGGIIATVLVVVTLLVDTHFFMAGYQKSFFDIQSAFFQGINELKEENDDLMKEVDQIKEKQEFLEKLMLERSAPAVQANR